VGLNKPVSTKNTTKSRRRVVQDGDLAYYGIQGN